MMYRGNGQFKPGEIDNMDKERQSIKAQLRFFLQQLEEQEKRRKLQEKEEEEEKDAREGY